MKSRHGQPFGLAARVESILARHWWTTNPSVLSRALQPLAALYGWLARRARSRASAALPLPVPVLVVGNLIVGGAGKTPTVMALVLAFQAAGRKPGVISRGHGRSGEDVRPVGTDQRATEVGDEPLLIKRRTGVPVWVGRERRAAALALCAAHPEVDVLISDDGLQHLALARHAELLVFDQRGMGNGLLLPAGPLREPVPAALQAHQRVLYTGESASTPLPGGLASKSLTRAWPLQAWQAGDASAAVPLASLRGKPLLAAAGMAAPEKFFAMLDQSGLQYSPLPLPDHHDYATLPWPADTPDVLITEKDAVKLLNRPMQGSRVWVLPLDFELPSQMAESLLTWLPKPQQAAPTRIDPNPPPRPLH